MEKYEQDTPKRVRVQRGFLLSADTELQDLLTALWPEDQLTWTIFNRGLSAVENLFNMPPDILVVDGNLVDLSVAEVVSMVKGENVYRQIPIVLCLEVGTVGEVMDWGTLEADDFFTRPFDPDTLKARINLTLNRASRSMDANPLTKLPGNTTIIHKIQELIDRREDFALAYADLDHFKSFNDKYGFSRGDEVLMMTARVIVNTIRGFVGVNSFVGHVGGDDFVFILPSSYAEEACKRVVAAFDSIVPHFYDSEDKKRGYIVSTDRKGEVQEFPMMAISIAVVLNEDGRLEHYGQASQIAMSLKKEAKKQKTSSYVIDRRN